MWRYCTQYWCFSMLCFVVVISSSLKNSSYYFTIVKVDFWLLNNRIAPVPFKWSFMKCMDKIIWQLTTTKLRKSADLYVIVKYVQHTCFRSQSTLILFRGWVSVISESLWCLRYAADVPVITSTYNFTLTYMSCSRFLGYHIKVRRNLLVHTFRHHDDVIKWKHFPRYWPFVREIHRSPVNFPHKGQWPGALMFSLIYAWINDWVNNREAGDLRRQYGHYDVIVMIP